MIHKSPPFRVLTELSADRLLVEWTDRHFYRAVFGVDDGTLTLHTVDAEQGSVLMATGGAKLTDVPAAARAWLRTEGYELEGVPPGFEPRAAKDQPPKQGTRADGRGDRQIGGGFQ